MAGAMLLIGAIFALLYVFVICGMTYEAISEKGFPRFFFKFFAGMTVVAIAAVLLSGLL